MENIPKITDKTRVPVEIRIPPYMTDHKFEGKAVLPAVEAMQLLAASTQAYLPDTDIRFIANARFDKFLYLKQNHTVTEAYNEIEVCENRHIISKLITKTRSEKALVTRVKEHVIISFPQEKEDIRKLAFDSASALKGNSFAIPSDKLYSDLVPFGPAYHNIKERLLVSEDGAVANIGQSVAEASLGPLGSPFPLDAAFHAACAWGQRFSGIVAFPVGFEKRFIFTLTHPRENYVSRIIPVNISSDLFIFDIWIYGISGILYEAVTGVRMRDVSAGRMRAPKWVMKRGL